MASPVVRHLARLWRSVPLGGLQQGATLSIRSNLAGPTHIVLKPEWRDNGHAELKQVFEKTAGEEHAELVVTQQDDHMTSMGRMASHVSLELEPQDEAPPIDGSESEPEQPVIPHHISKLPEKVILDDGTVLPDSDEFSPPPKGKRRVEYHDGVTHVTSRDEHEEAVGTTLSVQMPEKVNLICELNHGGSITITGKVEGDIKLFTADGDMNLTKLRGHTVDLKSMGPNNLIYIKDLIEAQDVSLKTTGRVRAKQIHGTSVNVKIEPSADAPAATPTVDSIKASSLDADDEGSLADIGSMYIAGNGGAVISVTNSQPSRRAVRVKSSHGPLRVDSKCVSVPTESNEHTGETYPIVELGGVNGNCEVSIQDTNSSENGSKPDWSSCLVHVDSLSPDSVSLVTTDRGNVSITLDRKVEADLRLVSSTLSDPDSMVDLGATIAEEEDPEYVAKLLRNRSGEESPDSPYQRISIETTAFTGRPHGMNSDALQYMDGWVENKSAEPDSRFERKVRSENASVGKIRLVSAADQALDGFSPAGDDKEGGFLRPLFAVVGAERIVVETVSWMGAIARRYGLEENERDLGRQASRRGRSLTPKE